MSDGDKAVTKPAKLAILCTSLFLASTTAACSEPAGAPGGLPPGYELVWSDEFDTPGLPDPALWNYEMDRNAEGWWNSEAQYYSGPRAKNARVEDGVLIIEAHKETLNHEDFPDWGGQDYTSTRLISLGSGAWTYGFFDVRAKLPCGRGTWPAIWTLGAPPHEDWPGGGEVDIMEHVGFDPNVIHGGVHTAAANHQNGNNANYSVQLEDVCGAFHNYQMTWTPDAIVLGVDGLNYFTFPNDHAGDDATWPFHRPQYLILNIAIGGSWGGRQGIDDAIFPVRMEVDYVRVYQREDLVEETGR